MTYVPPIRRVQLDVCAEYGVGINDILSRRQGAHVTQARLEAMRRAKRFTRASFVEIGRAFDRHHTTVMSACGALRRNR